MMALRGAVLLAALAASLEVAALPAEAGQLNMQTAGRTTQPVGHHAFCRRVPGECVQNAGEHNPLKMSPRLWKKLVEINEQVNRSVIPRTDMEIWGMEEHWSYPVDGVGDCEDYVLEKRRRLVKRGISPASLLITVVRQPNGDGHAVLTVRTNHGDFVLDNLEPRVLLWTETRYTYLKRQSVQHAGIWVQVNDGRADAVASVRMN